MSLVTVIVTTLNRPILLKDTLVSILNQTFQDFEIIVVDSYSDYNFFELINSLKSPKIKAYQNNKGNDNISINRNFGLKNVTSKYIAFCDDDDIWLPNKLEEQMKVVQKNHFDDEPILVHTNTFLFGETRKDSITKKTNIIKFEDFFSGNPVTYSSVLLSNSDWVHFDENPAKRASEDADLWIKLFVHQYRFFLINEPLVRYRIAISSASRTNYSFSYLRYVYLVVDAILIYRIRNFSILKFAIFIMKSLLQFSVRKLQHK
jgi:teichuronic acid biosynthesis glycosyltransferase TuaG